MLLRSLQRHFLALTAIFLSSAALAQSHFNLDSPKIAPATVTYQTSAAAAPRTIKTVNECPFTVWVGFTGGAIADRPICKTNADCTGLDKTCAKASPNDEYGRCSCSSNADCGTGKTCVKGQSTDTYGMCSCATDADCGAARGCNTQNKRCFWELPYPDSGFWALLAKGQKFFFISDKATFVLPEASYKQNPGQDIRFSGGIFPRTGCQFVGSNFVCETGDACGGAVCNPGQSGRPPATQIEFTFQNDAKDYYDLEVIDGATVPMEMKPDPGGDYQAVPSDELAEYWCGNPGGVSSTTGLSGCNWTFSPGTMNYAFVPAGGKACTKDSDCNSAANERCGLSVPNIAPPPPPPAPKPPNWGAKTCGKFLGYWSANSICGLNPNFGPPNTSLFDCNQPVPSANGPYGTMKNLYGCVVPRTTPPSPIQADSKCKDALCAALSCYDDRAKTSPGNTACCGCQQWPYPTETNCQGNNTCWQSYARTKLQFLKDACPTSYTYPYDDKTSTFKCRTSPGTDASPLPNKVSYTVTFCPGGKTGGMK